MTIGPSNPSPSKLGSDTDPIRQGLFASQSMKELLNAVKQHEKSGPFQTIAEAAKLVDEGMKKEAISVLEGILARPGVETRIQLWVWSALRELRVQPEQRLAFEILGVVLELPMQGAYDTLAAYQDGSARYLNFSGSAIFWDRRDEAVTTLCHAFLQSAVSAGSRAEPRMSFSLPRSGIQLTLLTRSGAYVVTDPPESTVKAATILMTELIRRAKTTREQKGQITE